MIYTTAALICPLHGSHIETKLTEICVHDILSCSTIYSQGIPCRHALYCYLVISVSRINRIAASISDYDLIISTTAIDRIPTFSSIDYIVPLCATDHIISIITINRIVTVITENYIISIITINHIISVISKYIWVIF